MNMQICFLRVHISKVLDGRLPVSDVHQCGDQNAVLTSTVSTRKLLRHHAVQTGALFHDCFSFLLSDVVNLKVIDVAVFAETHDDNKEVGKLPQVIEY